MHFVINTEKSPNRPGDDDAQSITLSNLPIDKCSGSKSDQTWNSHLLGGCNNKAFADYVVNFLTEEKTCLLCQKLSAFYSRGGGGKDKKKISQKNE